MAKEQTFNSPGFFEREIDLSGRKEEPLGVACGIVGTAKRGPAFVPVTVGSFDDFESKFGGLDSTRFGPYAVEKFFEAKTGPSAVTYVRVLGAGANSTTTDFKNTRNKGIVKSAGFKVAGTANTDYSGHTGVAQFLVARHFVSASEAHCNPEFTDNNSFFQGNHSDKNQVHLVRAVLFTASGTRFQVTSSGYNMSNYDPSPANDQAKHHNYNLASPAATDNDYYKEGEFLLILSSSANGTWKEGSGANVKNGLRVLTASLNPASPNYVSRILNTDPSRFNKEEHLLYADFAVEQEVAAVDTTLYNNEAGDHHRGAFSVALCSGSAGTSSTSGHTTLTWREAYGRFDTRYTTARTTMFISQPYGKKEYDLFYLEALDDGAYPNEKYKLSISNIQASTDPNDPYGTFTVEVRDFYDTDRNTQILESYPKCNLNAGSDQYVAKVIGDKKAYFKFDAEDEDERRLVTTGKYPNKSLRIRVIMSDEYTNGAVPLTAVPFGFRGVPTLLTNTGLSDDKASPGGIRLGMYVSGSRVSESPAGIYNHSLTGSIVPPLPFRVKCTRGQWLSDLTADKANPSGMLGDPGPTETHDKRLYWGVKFERVPISGSDTDGKLKNAILSPNEGTLPNACVSAYTKFLGIKKLDVLVTGTKKDEFNNNKFTLARVALGNLNLDDITGSADQHMLEASYHRNGTVHPTKYTITDDIDTEANKLTFAAILQSGSVNTFNRFRDYAKFNTIFYGGFDGVNILDKDAAKLNDRASSTVDGGNAYASRAAYSGLSANVEGVGMKNNAVASIKSAVNLITERTYVDVNIVTIPGIREKKITDYASQRVKDYALAFYIMDMLSYDKDDTRLYTDSKNRPDVKKTVNQFANRGIDNNYVATYFPDVTIVDKENGDRRVKVPASIAALGAISFNDANKFPWFAPAGFNRASLDFVTNVRTRLNATDRDDLYLERINPIATFPRQGFVIFGQKTLQHAKSALDRVNVRRLMIEVKRLVINIARSFVFEQNTPSTRARFVNRIVPILALIQANAGIENFKIVMDDSNNSQEDIENNILNGRIVVVPTRAVEFIAIDFIITNAGVEFV